MEELTILEIILISIFKLFILTSFILYLYYVFKSNQEIRSKNRYIKVLERKLKEVK
jgi:hypothetical protein